MDSDERAAFAASTTYSDDAIVHTDEEGVILAWTAGAQRLFGYTAAEARGLSIGILYPAGAWGGAHRYAAGFTGASRQFETVLVRKGGGNVAVRVTAFQVRGHAGSTRALGTIYHDVTAEKQAERRLVCKDAFAGLMQTLVHVANEVESPELAVAEGLRLVCRHGGWQLGHAVAFAPRAKRGAPLLTLSYSDQPERFAAFVELAKRIGYGRPGDDVVAQVLAQRTAVWVADLHTLPAEPRTAVLVREGVRAAFAFPVIVSGEVLAVLEFYGDATRPPEDALVESIGRVAQTFARMIERRHAADEKASLAAIVQGANDAIIGRSLDGLITSWNPAAERMLGYTAEEAIGKPIAMTVPPDLHAIVDANNERLRRGEPIATQELPRLRKDGSTVHVSANVSPVRDAQGTVIGAAVILRDITDRKRAEERMNHVAHHDPLTGLPNRGLLQDRLRMSIAHAKRRAESVGVLIAGIDRFRKINDSFGFAAGDALLRDVAQRIGSTLRDVDTLARLGADQFAILVDAHTSQREVDAVAQKVQAALREPFRVADRDVFVSVSTGMASFPDDGVDAHALLEAAERAMNRVKEEGGAGYRRSEGEAGRDAATYGIEAALHHALARGELEVHYQPRVELSTERVIGCEALLRWNNPELGAVSPACFIGIAEETGLIVAIGEWVVETACAAAARWRRAGHCVGVSVNLSPRQFRQADLTAIVAAALERSGLPAEFLELEITESTAMSHPQRAAEVLRELHALGVKLSVDDFGTGYSSLSYLREFPLDCLKIDKSFVRDICTSASNEAIVRATIALAHSLQLEVVGEGVESRGQHERLRALGCDEGQGFLYARPMDEGALRALLARESGKSSPQSKNSAA